MNLLEAVSFVLPATGGVADSSAYLRLAGGYVSAFDGSLAIGHPIGEDLALCPHAERLASALKLAGDKFSIAEQENRRVVVKGKKLRATIPCADPATIPMIAPDPMVAPITDDIRQGFKALMPLVREEAETLVEISFLLNGGTISSTNRNVILQFWHGVNMPPNLIVPRRFGQIVSKYDGLCGFGFSDNSLTFWYENGAYIRCSRMQGQWPDIDKVLNVAATPVAIDDALFEAVKAMSEFSEDGLVRFEENKVRSSYVETKGALVGATYDCEGLKAKCSFNAKQFLLLKTVATTIDFETHSDRAPFFGNKTRGMISKVLK